jgi:hypothetical protein
MLDYFLLHLTGPERRSLKVKDPEKYFFRPRELLQQIVQVGGPGPGTRVCCLPSLLLAMVLCAPGPAC